MVETKFQIVVYIVRTGTHNLATFHENVHTVNSVKCVSCKFFIRSTDFDKNFSKRSRYSTDHKNWIKFFFDNFVQHIWTQKIPIWHDDVTQSRLRNKRRGTLINFWKILKTKKNQKWSQCLDWYKKVLKSWCENF